MREMRTSALNRCRTIQAKFLFLILARNFSPPLVFGEPLRDLVRPFAFCLGNEHQGEDDRAQGDARVEPRKDIAS